MTLRKSLLSGVAAVVLVLAGSARVRAQDPAVVNAKTIRVKLENARVRVLEATLPPGAKEQLHSHPAYVIYVVAVGGDAHAGHTETSVLLHISPTDVLTDRWLTGNRTPLPELLPSMRRGGVAAVSPVGVLGDPTTATAAEGRRIFAEMVDECARRVARWRPGPDGTLT